MINLKSWAEFVLKNLLEPNSRYEVIDREHIIDNESGVEIHMYGDYFTFTHGEDEIATSEALPQDVKDAVYKIKTVISSEPPSTEWTQKKYDEAIEQRQKLSDVLEAKTPLYGKVDIPEDENATQYQG